MSDQPHKTSQACEAEVWNAIAAFEKILEALPNDHVSLETLADAYEKVGDHKRAKDYILRLANVFVDEADEDAAHDLLRKIKTFDQTDPQVQKTLARVENLNPKKVMALVLDEPEPLAKRPTSIAAEISFAWNLLQAKKLTQEEYANVVHDLSENSSKKSEISVSTLHVLHDRKFPAINDAIAFAAKNCKMPIVTLANFELQPKVTALLPLEFMIKRGAIVFELLGDDAFVGILNPYDPQLPIDIKDFTGKDCHCFLVTPADFDETLEKIKKQASPA